MSIKFFSSKAQLINLMFFLFISCAQQKSNTYFGNLNLKKIIPIDSSLSFDINSYFGLQYFKNDTTQFLVALDSDWLRFIDILDSSKSFSVDIKENFMGSTYILAIINNNNLFFLETTSRSILKYKIDPNSKKIILQKVVPLPDILIKGKDRYIRYLFMSSLEVQNNLAYIAYGLENKPKQHFLDKNAYLAVDLNNPDSLLPIPPLPIPQRYLKGKSYYASTYLTSVSDSQLLFGYTEYDSLYIFNSKRDSLEKRIKISANSQFFNFDKKKFTNLAYIRKHSLTSEANVNMIVNKVNQEILIIKRLAKKSITDTSFYEYYLYDTKLNLKSHNKIHQNIIPTGGKAFGEGFVFFDKNKKSFYYYEGK